jgi:hypothetical protein
MNGKKTIATALSVLAPAGAIAACGGDNGGDEGKAGSDLPQGSEPVDLNPADFTTNIDHPYWPIKPGSRWVYREFDSEGTEQRVDVTVLRKTKKVASGVEAAIVHDKVTEGDQLVEDTFDWYAQDRDGNVWYLGEHTTEYENGKPTTTEGSWESGRDGGQAGIIVPAKPEPGQTYRQEYYKGHAEDTAEVVGVREQAEVPFGHFRHVLMTKDLNSLEPKFLELKFYARGVGPVLSIGVSGGSDREELLSYRKGG